MRVLLSGSGTGASVYKIFCINSDYQISEQSWNALKIKHDIRLWDKSVENAWQNPI